MKIHKPGHIEHTSQANSSVTSTIWSIDFHPDGLRLATGGNDYVINIWNIEPIINKKNASNAPQKLASLDLHMGSVNCVRWSNISGKYLASGSDDKLVLIWELDRETEELNTSSAPKTESWKICKRLVGHSLDVMGLAWSKDNRLLASCGMDSKIIIWQNFESIQVLNLSSSVKGIAFDPLGEFLASQSDDQKVTIWKTINWEKYKVQDFQTVKKAGTFFQRLSWSPDGDYLATSNIMCHSSPTVAILDRIDFDIKFVFAGHGEPTEVSLFNPRQFKKHSNNSQEEKIICYCSLGGQDRTLTIWDSSLFNPQCAIKGLFLRSINDLSWSKSGYFLAACSTDGGVAILEFSEDELGIVVDSSLDKNSIKNVNQQIIIPSTSHQIALEESFKPIASLERLDLNRSENGLVKEIQKIVPPTNNQTIVVSTVNGKKKVQPLSFGVGNDALKTALSTNITQNNLVLLKENNNSVSELNEDKVNGVVEAAPVKSARVSPPSASMTLTDRKTGVFAKEGNSSYSEEKPVNYTYIEQNPLIPYLGLKRVKLDQPSLSARLVKTNIGSASLRIECDNNNLIHKKYARLVCYQNNSELWEDILGSTALLIESTGDYIAVALNSCDLITYSLVGSKVLPVIHLDSVASLLHIDGDILLCVSALGMVYLWDLANKSAVLAGVSIAPLLDGTNSENTKIPAIVVSTARIINQRVVITLSSGKVYSYDSSLMAWILLHDTFYSLSEYSSLSGNNILPIKSTTTNQLPLDVPSIIDHSMEKVLADPVLDPSLHRIISISHLEYQVASSLVLKSPENYKHWLFALIQRLTDEGLEEKIRELCRFLLGPPFGNEIESKILNLDKKDLLKESLKIIATNRKLQFLAAEYTQALEDLDLL